MEQSNVTESPLQVARDAYAFAGCTQTTVQEWCTQSWGKQLFVIAHLLYLNLEGMSRVAASLRGISGALERRLEPLDERISVLESEQAQMQELLTANQPASDE